MDPDDPIQVPIGDHLDLHAFRPRDIPEVVADYVDAARDKGLRTVRLIHGRGIGVQRAAVHRALAAHPHVTRFWDAPESHLGATIAELDSND
jgi:DNA-nicking Smr family endonuclease